MNDDVVRELLEALGADVFQDVCATFFEDTPPLFAAMHAGLAAGDGSAVRAAAHQLKSTTATLGAQGLSTLIAKVEAGAKAAASGDRAALSALAPLVERAEAAMPAVRAALERYG